MVKRTIFICVFIILLALCAKTAGEDQKLVRLSEEAIEEFGNIYINEDNAIISVYAYHGEGNFLKNLKAVTDLGKACELPVYLAIPPRKMDVAELPDKIDKTPHLALFELAEKNCKKAGVNYIDLLSSLPDEQLYFATDHHWTAKGAYLAYQKIIAEMGHTPYDTKEFTVETAHTKYRGSDYGKTNKSPDYTVYDTIELYYHYDYADYVATIVNYPYDTGENNEVLGGMYCMDSLFSWDPYTVYFKGNTPYITIRNGKDRPTLLMVRDSFASALAPFMVLHYDIVMVDPRFYPEGLSTVVKREKISEILVLENMGSFTENTIKFKY